VPPPTDIATVPPGPGLLNEAELLPENNRGVRSGGPAGELLGEAVDEAFGDTISAEAGGAAGERRPFEAGAPEGGSLLALGSPDVRCRRLLLDKPRPDSPAFIPDLFCASF